MTTAASSTQIDRTEEFQLAAQQMQQQDAAASSAASLSLTAGLQQTDATSGSEAPAAATPFNRYVELTPYLYHGAWETVCKILSIMILVAYIAAAVAGTIITGLLMPIYLPIAPVIAYIFVPHVYNGYTYFQGLAQEQAGKAYIENGVNKELRTTVAGIREHLSDDVLNDRMQIRVTENDQLVGPKIASGVDVERLRPVIARALFWENEATRLSQIVATHLTNATTAQQARLQANNEQRAAAQAQDRPAFEQLAQRVSELSQIVTRERIAALTEQEKALTAKVMAAYFRGVVVNPFAEQDHTELFTLHKPDVRDQLADKGLALTFGEVREHPFLINARGEPFTRDTIHRATVEQIRQVLFDPRPAAPAADGAGDRKELVIPPEPGAADSKGAAVEQVAAGSEADLP